MWLFTTSLSEQIICFWTVGIAGALLSLHANQCLLSNSGMALDLLFAMIRPKIASSISKWDRNFSAGQATPTSYIPSRSPKSDGIFLVIGLMRLQAYCEAQFQSHVYFDRNPSELFAIDVQLFNSF
jgi:hypothetical protein